MSGSPTFTIVLSKPTMNRLMQQRRGISPRRPRPDAGGDTGAAAGAGVVGWGPESWAGVRERRAGRRRAPAARPGYGYGPGRVTCPEPGGPRQARAPGRCTGIRSGSRSRARYVTSGGTSLVPASCETPQRRTRATSTATYERPALEPWFGLIVDESDQVIGSLSYPVGCPRPPPSCGGPSQASLACAARRERQVPPRVGPARFAPRQ